jgi:diaminopimelate epimerase
MDVRGLAELSVRTERGLLQAREAGGGLTSVNMGQPMTEWRKIPLAEEADTLHLPIEGDPVAASMGNPHCTFFVEDAEAEDLETRGAEIEVHPLFPERTNVQFVSVHGPDHLRMRVWERGTGVTLASGSSSCAVAVAAARRGLTGRKVRITLDGGEILVEWRETGVWMTGPTMHVFSGTLTPQFLEAL